MFFKKMLGAKVMFIMVVMCLSIFCCGCDTEAKEYSDTNHWGKNYIDYVTAKELFFGVSESEFCPDGDMTRGMFITVLNRQCGSEVVEADSFAFNDVGKNDYYAEAVAWATATGVAKGTGEYSFSPNAPISRQDAAVMIYNYQTHITHFAFGETGSLSYVDEYDVSSYAKEAVYALTENGIFQGYLDGSFSPTKSISRAEAAVILSKMNGVTCDIFTPIEVPKVPAMEYLGNYKLTCYCSSCNSPAGSRRTASGKTATAGEYGTVAVSSSLYRSLGANTILYIDGVGYRTIHDKHGSSSGVIDVYFGEGTCTCSKNRISGKVVPVYIVR